MSIEGNKEVVRQFTSDFNACGGDSTKIRALFEKYAAPDFVTHNLIRGDINREQRLQNVLMVMPAMPDLNYIIEDLVAEGDKVVARYIARFTHKGTYMGIPATGKQIVFKGAEIFKIAGGKFVETWDFPDALGMLTQLGVIPSASPKK